MVIKSKAKTDKELKKELRSLTPYWDELEVGDHSIVKTSTGYGCGSKYDKNDPLTDYNKHVFGFKEKWIVERAINDRLIKKSTNLKIKPKLGGKQ